ncbi:MAG: hypothetical protein NT089_11440 [Planctomycetia bacterium]|nr:hypothetical protein [Planctomycetia bacterium]
MLAGALLLGVLIGIGIVAIVIIRSWSRRSSADRGDWESVLSDYKNLRDRDKGVLSEEEYRKIRTLVELKKRDDSLPFTHKRLHPADPDLTDQTQKRTRN